jgi:archaellum biogenesis ATPase FlaH
VSAPPRITYPEPDGDRTFLPCAECGQAAVADLHRDKVTVRCFVGCPPEATLRGTDRQRLRAELQELTAGRGRNESPRGKGTGERIARTLSFEKVERERVEWQVTGRVPRGAVTLLIGDPGLGKSLLTIRWAADTSRDGRDVLLVTAEDSLAVTVLPRLEVVGADLGRVHAVEMASEGVEDGLRLPDDLDELERLVVQHQAQLVVIDPLMAHLPENVNSWRDQSVRRALAPLHRLAEAHGCAVVVIGHLNKAPGTEALYRAGGSIGISGAARSVLLLARDPEDPEGDKGVRRVLAHVKCNLASKAPSLAYRVEPVLLDDGTTTARLVAYGESEATDAQLLSRRDDEDAPQRTEAESFLSAVLEDGPVPAKTVKRAADDAGIAWRTVERAKTKLGVKTVQVGGKAHGGWVWQLPEDRGGLTSAERNPHISNGGGLTGEGGGLMVRPPGRHADGYGGLPSAPPRPGQVWHDPEAPHHRLRVLAVDGDEARVRTESQDGQAGREGAVPLTAFGGSGLRRVV